MTDISELVKRLRERSGQYDEYGWHSEIELEAADALEAQAKEIRIYQQTELIYVTRVADLQREYSEMQAKLKARIAELETALKGWQQWWGLPWQDRRPDIAERCYRDAAALKGEKG